MDDDFSRAYKIIKMFLELREVSPRTRRMFYDWLTSPEDSAVKDEALCRIFEDVMAGDVFEGGDDRKYEKRIGEDGHGYRRRVLTDVLGLPAQIMDGETIRE